MNELDMRIKKVREEMHELIEKYGMAAEEVVKKSQELDRLITLKQQEVLYGNRKSIF